MPKITNHDGATVEGQEREVVTAADELRRLGKLGPYTDAPDDGLEVEPDGTLSPPVEGDGSGEPLPEIEDEVTDDAADQDDPDEVEDDSESETDSAGLDSPQRPAVNAPKADWVAYASSIEGAEVDSDAWTKAELIEQYGD